MKRNVKSQDEILAIEKACMLADKTLDFILPKIKPGVTEKQIATEIVKFIRKNNASLSFRPIVAFGKNCSSIHHKPTHQKLSKNDQIMIDLGAKLNGYCSDITRTIFTGKATNEQKRMYKTVLDAQEKAINFISSCYSSGERAESRSFSTNSSQLRSNNNIFAKIVDRIAREHIISENYPSFPHGLGHGIGRKVHEGPRLSPKSKRKLRVGMVFSVEPGIYLKDFGGVRIEDLVVLEKSGPRLLTHFTKGIIEL
ncbi:M24 family metallopeptidase [Candidatus Microgenomates bacterium]|nr:MAG: M24 family metallopeptidase [Candidatus Microgenomates bacterium]